MRANTTWALSGDIAERIRRRDPTAFDELIRVAGPRLIAFLVSYVHSRETAEDLFQNILFRLFELGERFVPTESVEGYLFTSARNAAITFLRHTHTEERYTRRYLDEWAVTMPVDLRPADDELSVWEEELALMRKGLSALTEHQRIAFQLRYGEGLTIPEIARVLNITAKGAERLMTRIRKLLREQITGDHDHV